MKNPKYVLIKDEKIVDGEIKLIVKGQGVYIFEKSKESDCSAFMFVNKKETNSLFVKFSENNIIVERKKEDDLEMLIDKNNNKGLCDIKGAYYWFSLDSQNQTLYAGVGETRLETSIYKYQFTFNSDDERKENKAFLESLSKINIGTTIPLKILRDPITLTIPLLVKNRNELTMDDVAKGKFMPNSNLSTICQKLYNCITGPNFKLDDDSFPDFSKAIEYSIITEGMWCNKRLKEKSYEFNKDKPNPYETYLRITLGENNGESPGVPYVMEIWPIGHYSPIHNHAGSNAIVRVLHGSINVKLFRFLCNDSDKDAVFGVADFNKEDITWISPTLNQTHQLTNLGSNKDTCITIQCYMYDEDNKGHYDYFDYIDINGDIKQYEPDSDMDFVDFKELMRKEWDAYKNKQKKKTKNKSFKENITI